MEAIKFFHLTITGHEISDIQLHSFRPKGIDFTGIIFCFLFSGIKIFLMSYYFKKFL